MNFLGGQWLMAHRTSHHRIEVMAAVLVLMKHGPAALIRHMHIAPMDDGHHDRMQLKTLLGQNVFVPLWPLLICHLAQYTLPHELAHRALLPHLQPAVARGELHALGALDHDPGQSEARYNLGNLLVSLGERNEGLDHLRRAVASWGKGADDYSRHWHGRAAEKLGRFAQAAPPEIVVFVADATNLRLNLGLALELDALQDLFLADRRFKLLVILQGTDTSGDRKSVV